jgi:hypothetical protein
LKKAIVIFFLSIYLFGATPLGELLKIPLLIEHFVEHKSENKSISFFTFLKMHYFNGDPHDADYEKDMKLPFKTISINSTIAAYCYGPNFMFNLSRPTFAYIFKHKFSCITENFYSNYLNAIWQPPRLV